jgi:hypothetical protein
MNIIDSRDSRSPLVFHSSYNSGLLEIVYKLSDGYTPIDERHYDVVRHINHRWSMLQTSETFKPYTDDPYFFEPGHAYGLLINPYSSALLVLDIDEDDEETLTFVKYFLMCHPSVETIDIALSSVGNAVRTSGKHIYAGLTGEHNLFSFYENGIEGTCKWFNRLVCKKRELVIRVSQKFYKNVAEPSSKIVWHEGYTKLGEDKWLKFTSEQLIAPLITADVYYLEKFLTRRSQSLRLRG